MESKKYWDIKDTGTQVKVSEFKSTWPNGNDPDGSTIVDVYVHGSDESGYVIVLDDNQNGGMPNEAGSTVYPTFEVAMEKAKEYSDYANED